MKTSRWFVVAMFFGGMILGGVSRGCADAKADGSMENPLNRIDNHLVQIVTELHGIKEKMK